MTATSAMDALLPGGVPHSWSYVPLWTLVRRLDVTNRPDAELLSVYRDHGVVPKSSRDDNFNKASEDLTAYRYVRPGDLVLNKMKTWQGSLAISDYEGIVSPAYIVCEVTADVHRRYLHYLLRSRPYVHMYRALSKGIRPNQWDLPFDEFRKVPVILPPIQEQRRIADFLDAETARIDGLRAMQSSVMSLLVERETARLDGVIDRLFATYGATPMRRLITRIEQGSSPQCDNVEARLGEWGVLKVSAVKNGRFQPAENKRLPEGQVPLRRYEIRHGDLLVTRANTPLLVGAAAVAHQPPPRLLLCDKIFRIEVEPEMDKDYLALVAQGSRIRSLCAEASHGTSQSMANLKTHDIKDWPIPPAPFEVQRQVVAEVKADSDAVGRLRALIGTQLRVLEERRQALITAAVTGQFDVTTGRGADLS